ncbi:MAG TPA: Hsp70 family protein, partial [Pyrinomonadaceae bacterium]|nr:Hsp70 family protein [Pyrinomonadaceae bacterium]
LRNSLTFTTVVDNQSSVEIHILQGERDLAEGNRSLGKFELVGIPPSPRGVPQIEVSFEVDANGIVSVSAMDKATGRAQQMRITPTSGLPPDEIDRLIKDAEASAETDRQTKEAVVLRNKLETLLRNTQKSFTKFGGLLSANDQKIAEGVFAESEVASNGSNLEDINSALSKLERVAADLTVAMMRPENEDVTTEVGGNT